MGSNHLPPAINFHPDIRQAITIFIMLAIRTTDLMICPGHYRCVPVKTYPKLGQVGHLHMDRAESAL
jgi:hypothetical protein